MLARAIVILAALGVGAFGLARGTWAVGGSDSSCYALMADAFARGQWQPASALAVEAPWPDASRSFAPGGFVPSPVTPGAASPICTPGFSLLLAPLRAIGGRDAIFLLTPVAGALLIWLTYLLGRALSGVLAGVLAAVVMATTPVLLFQVVQPMNDVTVAALWTAAFVLLARVTADSGAASRSLTHMAIPGFVAGAAVLVRPNLAPIAVVIAAWILVTHVQRWRAALAFSAAVIPGVLVTATLNQVLYGRALASGYGNAGDLFALTHIGNNVSNYGSALLRTQLGLPLLAVAAPFLIGTSLRAMAWLLVAVSGVVVAIYSLYTPFPEWWYLRFFLPILPATTVLALVTTARILRRPRLVVSAASAVILFTTTSSAAQQATTLSRLEHRFRATAELVTRELPANAAFVTVWESGSIRYHGGLQAVMWDAVPPESLEGVVSWLAGRDLVPFIIVEEWEEPLFRQRFGAHAAIGTLDWPPRFEIERQVKIFDPRDRARYLAGEPVPTQRILPPRR